MTLTEAFEYRDGALWCEDTPLSRVVAEAGTPCYVYSKSALVANYRSYCAAFSCVSPLVCYAMKANSNLEVLRLLKDEGAGFDIVSGGELFRLRKLGVPADKVVFSGAGKLESELEMALDPPVLSINLESVEELQTLASLSARRQVRPDVSLRINPDVDAATHPYIATGLRQHKFGLDLDQVEKAVGLLRRSEHLRLIGVGFHVGSQILDVAPFLEAFVKLRALADELRRSGFPIRHLDLGGGVGIPYRGETPADLARYARFVGEHRADYQIILEPGRFIAGNAGALLNQVLYTKVNHGKRFVIVDGAMNDLMRPSLYQAHHEILPLVERSPSLTADVVGPVCESGDFFARGRLLPEFRQGDYLAVMNAGAYGFVLSSNYNARLRAAEVLVEGDRFRVVRRRETHEDLVRGEE
jgi:diaminopimelate decarboxylase